jgi:hypothetical protein
MRFRKMDMMDALFLFTEYELTKFSIEEMTIMKRNSKICSGKMFVIDFNITPVGSILEYKHRIMPKFLFADNKYRLCMDFEFISDDKVIESFKLCFALSKRDMKRLRNEVQHIVLNRGNDESRMIFQKNTDLNLSIDMIFGVENNEN